VASERGVARAGRTDETTNVIHAFRPEGRSGASEFRVGLEIEMALHRSRSEDESDLWTDALHARLEAPRASNDADVSSLSILELKRDRTPREVIAQALDYASWVAKLSTREVHEIAVKYLKRDLEGAFRERFKIQLPETLNESHTMVIIASKFDPSSQRIVRYLSESYDIAINTAFFTVFEDDGKTLLATDWLLHQAEVVERSEAKAKGPWSGLWYVNIGDAKSGPLLEQKLTQPGIAHDGQDAALADHVVGVDWIKTVPIAEAKRFDGIFANPLIVCKLRDPKTIDFLRDQFGVSVE
jgi:hypothetical protein